MCERRLTLGASNGTHHAAFHAPRSRRISTCAVRGGSGGRPGTPPGTPPLLAPPRGGGGGGGGALRPRGSSGRLPFIHFATVRGLGADPVLVSLVCTVASSAS